MRPAKDKVGCSRLIGSPPPVMRLQHIVS